MTAMYRTIQVRQIYTRKWSMRITTVMGLTMNQPVINNVFHNCFINSEKLFITILTSQQSTA